jgi:hypothetical protein
MESLRPRDPLLSSTAVRSQLGAPLGMFFWKNSPCPTPFG